METSKPNYIDLGLSLCMGPKLRKFVEKQLLQDLSFYTPDLEINELNFDWSESCIEGHDLDFLDGSLENFSGITIFNKKNELVAEGWMEFVHAGNNFMIIYWDFISIVVNKKLVDIKTKPGIPEHIWKIIPEEIKPTWENERMKKSFFNK